MVGYGGKDLQKRKVLSLEWKSERVMDDESGESMEPMEAKEITLKYDTIWDAILTCTTKPTWVSLIYHTETTTKKCKTEKQKK